MRLGERTGSEYWADCLATMVDMQPLLTTSLPGLPAPRRGKVREVYDLGDRLLIIATDRISAFDVVMEQGIPDKGRILTQMSTWWFSHLGDLARHHIISTDDAEIASALGLDDPSLKGRCTLAVKAKPLTIECVARGYIAGSLFKEYRDSGDGRVRDMALPSGLQDGSRLPEVLFTPATKAEEGHDENISFSEACGLVGREVAEEARDLTLRLYQEAAKHAESVGIILADTKFEFGLTDEGLIWIDEALTPDSSRYWEASAWKPGGPQPSFDKQPLRDWLDAQDWNKQPPPPALSPETVAATRDRYLNALIRITGQGLPE